jgi:antitoxin (DNA-binding transcriptional repressor) of toxin-antitoxin stability system
MKTVTVSVLRQHLPAYLAQVEQGTTFRVTLRGRAIAELSRPSSNVDEATSARARLRGSLVHYTDPLRPMVEDDWEMNR